MTANVKVEIAKRTDALRVPNAALRFRPTAEVFAALNQALPPSDGAGRRRAAAAGSVGRQGGDRHNAGSADAPTRSAAAAQRRPARSRRRPAAQSSDRGAAPSGRAGEDGGVARGGAAAAGPDSGADDGTLQGACRPRSSSSSLPG